MLPTAELEQFLVRIDRLGWQTDTLDDLAAAQAVGARCVLYDGGSHHREALEATGEPVVDRLTDAVAAAQPRVR